MLAAGRVTDAPDADKRSGPPELPQPGERGAIRTSLPGNRDGVFRFPQPPSKDNPTMTDLTGTTPSSPSPAAPAILELERMPWHTSTAPRYIGLFLWVVFFDQLGRRTLPVGGLLP